MNIRSDLMESKINNFQRISEKKIQESMERLSTGLRINGANDDAAGLQISTRMNTLTKGLNSGIKNIQSTIDLLKSADSGSESVLEQLQRLRELSVMAQNSTYSIKDKETIDKESKQILANINKTAETVTYNGIAVLQGDKGLKFSQVNQYAQVKNLNFSSNEVTFSTWVKPSEFNSLSSPVNDYAKVFDTKTSGTGTMIIEDDKGISFRVPNIPTSFWYTGSGTLPDVSSEQWSNVILTYDGQNASIYVDGALKGQRNIGAGTVIFDEIELSTPTSVANAYYGEMNDFQVWDRALNQEEINLVTEGNDVSENLFLKWDLDNNDNNLLTDESGNERNATIYGAERIIVGPKKIEFNMGKSSSDTKSISLNDISTYSLGLENLMISDENALNSLDQAIDYVLSVRSEYGAELNVLEFSLNNQENEKIQNESSKLRIEGADMAIESSNYVKEKMKLETTISMMKQNTHNREQILGLLSN